jgi:hypothetical protein
MALNHSHEYQVRYDNASGQPAGQKVGAVSVEHAIRKASELAGYPVEPTAIYEHTRMGWERVQ